MNRAVALFDFDGTLVTGDSLPAFIACCVGWPRTVMTALFAALVTLRTADRRTAFKALWLRLTLRGFPLARLPAAQDKLAQRLRWLKPQQERLHWHKQRGDVIVIASGGLDLYLAAFLREVAPDHILCTVMEQGADMLTGVMRSGNCVRAEKKRRVAELLAMLEPHGEVWAYGNLPHDLPMMELATHRVIV
jgi:phosphatidylglycerophosphatase C